MKYRKRNGYYRRERGYASRSGVLENTRRGEIQTQDGGVAFQPAPEDRRGRQSPELPVLSMGTTGAHGEDSFIQQRVTEPLLSARPALGAGDRAQNRRDPDPCLRKLSFQTQADEP